MESVVSKYLNSYKGKKVFVTGHTGFKGAWFITWLHQLGAIVKGYALPPENDNDLFNIISPNINFENTFGDIRSREKLATAIKDFQPDFIFHLAAQALVRRSYEIPAETFDVNVTGTANLLEAVNKLDKKCTVVIITTDKVYENKETGHYYTEDDVLGGYDPYSASKAATEIVVGSFRNSFFNAANYATHLKAIASARAGNVIGGGDWNKDRIVPDIVRSLKKHQPVPVRNPAAVRPWQHVLEPLSGYLLLGALLDEDAVKYSGAYNFGPVPDDHLEVKELVQTAINTWGSGDWIDKSDALQPHEATLLKLNIDKAKNILGWHPLLTNKEAIQWTFDWYKQDEKEYYNFTVAQIKNYQQK
ncbi:MAG: CDP-glucose 4,6-dehydratase [Ferruginibacter sp.]|nr:CDP-glucose 4,6-dehydratase [Ferruginibacter sp.]